MVAISKALSSAVCLASLAAAIPRTTHHSASSNNGGSVNTGGWPHTNPPPGNSPTPPGTNPPAPPGGSPPPSSPPPPAGGATTPNRKFAAEYYNTFPQHPDISDSPIAGVHLEAYEGASQRETVAVFNGIPPEAKDCTFGWTTQGPDDRIFITKLRIVEGGSSDLRFFARQLSGFPEDGVVSWNSILPFDNIPVVGTGASSDFANWDEPHILQPFGASGANLTCAEDMYLTIGFRETDSLKHVYLVSDIASGIFIEYTL